MFALLSHEIRTPLNGVLGMAGLLQGTNLDATQSAYLATLKDCADHLLGLVNNVLDLAKLEAGALELEPVPTAPEHLLQGVCELLSPRAHAGGVEIGWVVDADVPVLLADDGRLRQILFNLAGNAVKLTREGGVLVSARRRGEMSDGGRARVRFTVADTGPGLAEEDQARIFEDFVQAEAGERAGGAGLGLAIVKKLVDAFSGELGVESRAGEGATFWFEADFDLAAPPEADRALAGLRAAVETGSPIVRDAAAGQLAAAGAMLVAPHEADIVLVDIGAAPAPDPAGKGPPRLALLAPEARDRIEALRAQGYAGYLIKPLRRVSVVERVLATVQPASGAGPASQDERARPAAPPAGLRVLLAEDNPVNALLARTLLTRHGCTVDQAGGGAEAVAAVLARDYDLVLMDMRMPGMSGLEAARAIRSAGCATPVVALTANAFDDDRRACLEAGMDDFLPKPLDPAALEALLARLRPRATATASRL